MSSNDHDPGTAPPDLELQVSRQVLADLEAQTMKALLGGDPCVSTSEPLTFEKIRTCLETLSRSCVPWQDLIARRLEEFNRAAGELEKRGLEQDWIVEGPRVDFPIRFYMRHRHTGLVASPALLYGAIDVVSRLPGPSYRVWPRLPRKTKKAIRAWRAMRGRRELRRVRRYVAKRGRRSVWGIT